MRQLMLTMAMLLTGAATAARAQAPAAVGDVQEGHRLALKICDACHVVAPDQEFPPILRNPAPSFQSIADRPDTTAASLRNFITNTHRTLAEPGTMPNPELTEDQVGPLVSYILSLRGRAPAPKR